MSSGELKITGGVHLGQTLKPPENMDIRPLRSRVRKALFDLLAGSISEARVLDCFAGTGALGLEAISRGAESCVFLDRSQDALQIIEENVRKLGESNSCDWFRVDVLEDSLKERLKERKFDLLFLTPPYRFFKNAGTKRKLINQLDDCVENGLLRKKGTVVIEHETGDRPGKLSNQLETIENRAFGKTTLRILRKRNGRKPERQRS